VASATSIAAAQPLMLASQHVALDAAPLTSSAPLQLESFNGMSEQAAVAAAGTGNAAVTTPADPSIAAGANNVVEAVNSALEIYSRAGTPLAAMSINAMTKNTPGWNVRDPRVVFDPVSGLFILMVLQYNASSCGSQVAVMVSQSNPALAWTSRGTVNIDSELGPGLELGTVALGLTANVVVESSDYQTCVSGTAGAFVASQTVILQRADLTNGTLTPNSSSFFASGPLGLQPAMAPGAAAVEYEVANDATCSATASGSVAVLAIAGTPDARNVSHTCTAESETTATSAPPDASQQGTAAKLNTGDDRFLSAVWQNNALWIASDTSCTPSGDSTARSCLDVMTLPANATGSVTGVTQLAAEGVNGEYLYYPSLALDSTGDVIVTFDESSTTAFESIMVAPITAGNVWGSFITVHTSSTFYSPAACTTCTWGDYSTAVQDALHPTDVWVVSEDTDGNTGTSCASANTCWNTFVGRYTFAGPSISSLTPAEGPATGGTLVTVSGSDFAVGSTLAFAGIATPITGGSLTPDSFTFTTPSSSSSGLVQAQVTDGIGTSPVTVGSGYIYVGLANYAPLSPFRILDTRPGSTCVQCTGHPLSAGTIWKLQLTGVTGLSVGPDPIPTTATAVVLNVTEVAGTASSLLTVYPFGTPKPNASNLNFPPGKVIPNLVTVTMGQGGAVNIYNAAGTVNVIADVEGYFAPQASSDPTGEFHPIAPVRVCDTRPKSPTPACSAHGALGGGGAMVVNVTGTGAAAVPNDGSAAAVVVNLTGVAGTALTYLSLFPTNASGQCTYTGTHAPPFSTLNLSAGAVEANRVMVALGPATTGGPLTSLCVYNAAGSINVLLDAGGWFGSATAAVGSQYQGIAPTRICDTRTGSGLPCAGHTLGTGGVDLVVVAGMAGIPAVGGGSTAVAVIANLTAIAPTASTFLALYPANLAKHPNASDINVGPGQVLPNLVVVQLAPTGSAGDVDLFNAAGTVNAVIDIEGWFQ